MADQGKTIAALAVGAMSIVGVSLVQLILPFAFDFFTNVAVYGIGFYMGQSIKKP